MKHNMIYKNNFDQRLRDLTKTMDFIITDFTEKYDLKIGCRYKVETTDGNFFVGFFRNIKASASVYRNGIDAWCCFYAVKKDGTPAKTNAGALVSKIVNVSII